MKNKKELKGSLIFLSMKYLFLAVLFVSCSVVKIKHNSDINFIPGQNWQVIDMTHADSILLDSIVRNYHD